MFSINQEYVDWYFESIIRIISRDLQISNWDWEDVEKLKSEIQQNNPSIHRVMSTFFTKYNEWVGKVDNDNVDINVIMEREAALNELARVVNEFRKAKS
ncbi:hypothetical protein FP507_02305 [Chlorobium phaeovibrioides]|uniref:Uncharacterized protein n=1 Tax=Chlorobium phaeovibrioides TaxID=1094 RepID=A0A5M8I9K0_CHLPH|nr:hypothetical protein [Chlorobium phaeovibrioides]KAA6232061.1 hypothetical protein FP507_02305 [Chlorobium phaeovibrioides]